MQISGVFPAMTLQDIAKVVRDADGSYDLALGFLMSKLDDSAPSNSSPEASEARDLEFDKAADIIRLKSQFARKLNEVYSVIGEGTQTEETVLQTIEKVKGDVQEAILQLLSMPSAEQPSHSETSSSREALRVSATHISAASSLRTSSGIEELPINVNLSYLDDVPSPAASSAPSVDSSASSLASLPYPASMTSVQISPAPQVTSAVASSQPPSQLSSQPSSISSATATASSSAPVATKLVALNASVQIEPSEEHQEEIDSDEIDNADWGVVEYDDDEYDDYYDEDDEIAAAIARSEQDKDWGLDSTGDFLTMMVQQEFDEILAAELHRQIVAGADPFAPSVIPPASVLAGAHLQPVRYHPVNITPIPAYRSPNVFPRAQPVVPDPVQPCHRKFGPDNGARRPKKQIPSGPKYYAQPRAQPVPVDMSPLGWQPEQAAAAAAADAAPTFDRDLLQAFVQEHPVRFATAAPGASGRDAMPVVNRVARGGEALSLAHTVRKLKQLYEARIAALAPVKKKNNKKAASSSSAAAGAGLTDLLTSTEISIGARESSSNAPVESQTGAPALFDITDYVTRMFESARYKEPQELIAMQHEELRSLRVLYSSDRLIVSESVPTVVCVSLVEPSFEISRPVPLKAKGEDVATLTTTLTFRNPLFLQLVAALPPFYPDIAPSVSVRSLTPNCPLSEGDLLRLEAYLKEAVKTTAGTPSIANLVSEAESWLCEDSGIRKAMLADHHALRSAELDDVRFEPQLFASLSKIFNFERDYSILDAHDVLTQRSKLLNRAVTLLINGRSVLYAPTPGNPSEDGESQQEAFPILDASGAIDEEASLRGIGLTVGAVRVILQYYNWNLGKLSAAYLSSVARGTYETFLSEAGVAPIADRFAMQHYLPRAATEILECPTCLDTRPFHAMFGLVCGHMLCKQCYSEYVDYELSSGGGLSNLTCPSPGCKYTLDQASLAGLLSPQRWASYVNMLVAQFVQASPALHWCPGGKGCERLVQEGALDSEGVSSVLAGEAADNARSHIHPIPNATSLDQTPLVIQCRCSYTFCNSCKRQGGHFPASCTECNAWDKSHEADQPLRDHAADDALSAHFVRTHSRQCPNCTAAISKNGGCVHMRCVSCRYEFCWVCSNHWDSSHYGCSENSIVWNMEANVRLRYRNFDSLLGRHRMHSFPAITKLRTQLIAAIYREDKTTKKTASLPGANAVNNRYQELAKPISFEDVPTFIDAIELLFLADYIVTNACKAGFALAEQGITSNNALLSCLLRALDDITFLSQSFNISPLHKEHVNFVSAGMVQLKASMRIIVETLSTLRLTHLNELARAPASS